MRIPGLAANLELSFVSVSMSENTREMLDREGGFFHALHDGYTGKRRTIEVFCHFRLKILHLIRCIPHSFEAEQTGSTRLTPGQRRGQVPGRGKPQTNNYRADTGARRGPGLAFVNYDIYLMSDHSQ